MARIGTIRQSERDRKVTRLHDLTDCEYSVYEVEGRTFLQLDTLGSKERQDKGQPSQILQLDEEIARQLLSVLRSAFPGIDR